MFEGVARVTLPLPMGPKHVHAYLLEEPDGWTLVDCGLALPDAEETFARRAASTSTSTSRTIIGPRVMIENGFEASASVSMHARVSR